MPWTVRLHPEFQHEFDNLELPVRMELDSLRIRLSEDGPMLGRPHVDTLYGSQFSNLKELRFSAARGVWRVAFAFDPTRVAILLVAGNKRGQHGRRFYERFVRVADDRYADHLNRLRRGWRGS